MVCLKSPLQGNIYTDTEVEFQPSLGDHKPAIELQGLIANVSNVAQRFKNVAADPSAKPICHLHTACLTQVVRWRDIQRAPGVSVQVQAAAV